MFVPVAVGQLLKFMPGPWRVLNRFQPGPAVIGLFCIAIQNSGDFHVAAEFMQIAGDSQAATPGRWIGCCQQLLESLAFSPGQHGIVFSGAYLLAGFIIRDGADVFFIHYICRFC